MPVIGTLITGGDWDGYYPKRVKVRPEGGPINVAQYSQLDAAVAASEGGSGEEDAAVLQHYADKLDRRINSLLRYTYKWDESLIPIPTDHDIFEAVSDVASELMVVEVYGARGLTDVDNPGSPAGKMEVKRKWAEARLAQLLVTRGTVATEDAESGWTVVELERVPACPVDEFSSN